jgi:transposase
MLPVSATERRALDHDYRYSSDRLVRQRSHIVLLALDLDTQKEVAQVVRCSADSVRRTLSRWRQGGRSGLRRRRSTTPHFALRNLSWQKALAEAMQRGAEACGVPRPTWSAELLARYLAERTGIETSERTVRRGLASLGYRLGRPTWSVRHKAEEEPNFAPKKPGWRPS